ncbi:MAG: alpha/beta fold hydrolase [Pirellulaceae bacterium]
MVPYRPHPLLRNGHLQTLMVGLHIGFRPPHNAEAIEIGLPDGEALIVHEELAAESAPPLATDAPLVILIHGLGGDHTSPYLQRLAYRLRQTGLRVWRVDLRGCGQGLRLAWRPAHAGRSQDLAAVVEQATRRYPAAPVRIVGFSLSGNILLKMLGEAAAGALQPSIELSSIESALAIAPPANLHNCADNMDRRSRKIYSHYYLRMLDKQVVQRKAVWPQWRDIPPEPRPRTIREFDAKYTAPLSGFRDTDHYYTESSAMHWLSHITTPTTLLVDLHDPIVTAKSFEAVKLNQQSTQLITTSHGGHMGYFSRDRKSGSNRWMEHFVFAFLAASSGKSVSQLSVVSSSE